MTRIDKQWCPYTTYVCTLRDIQRWFDRHGAGAFYDGVVWELKYKRLCPGRYKVSFEKAR